MKTGDVTIDPGPIVLMGSGETAPAAQKIFHWVFSAVAGRGNGDSNDNAVRMAILETPAGFEPNSGYVAEQVARFVEKRLQNFAPAISVVPARRRGANGFSTDDPLLAQQLHDANVLFMGPGSPTYAVRQLQQSCIWETLRACQRQGAAIVFSSAATLAASRWTLPIYEIYKAGSDLYWQEGLDFFSAYGLSLILVSHWNNADGGSVLDTSRCYLGEPRFQALLELVPGGTERYTIVGIDENTALAIEPQQEMCTVVGTGSVTIIRMGVTNVYAAGERFAAKELGDFHLPTGADDLDREVWEGVERGRQDGAAQRAAAPEPREQGRLRPSARQKTERTPCARLRRLPPARTWREGTALHRKRWKRTDGFACRSRSAGRIPPDPGRACAEGLPQPGRVRPAARQGRSQSQRPRTSRSVSGRRRMTSRFGFQVACVALVDQGEHLIDQAYGISAVFQHSGCFDRPVHVEETVPLLVPCGVALSQELL